MARDSIILEFPSGRRRPSGALRRPRSIASIAASLSIGFNDPTSAIAAAAPLAIRLDELSGMADPTIARLNDLAHAGSLTPASAARLALRHADEVHGRFAAPTFRRHCRPGLVDIQTTLVGDPFGSFALSHRRGNEWVGVASMYSVDRLHELCPPERDAACLLVGCDAARRTSVRLLSPVDWRRRLVRLRAVGSTDPNGHVLVIGSPSLRGARRQAILGGVERALRRGGVFAAMGSDRRRVPAREPTGHEVQATANLLILIEMAFPGLVDVDRSAEEARS